MPRHYVDMWKRHKFLLSTLDEPKTIVQLRAETGLSRPRLSRLLAPLVAAGKVSRTATKGRLGKRSWAFARIPLTSKEA